VHSDTNTAALPQLLCPLPSSPRYFLNFRPHYCGSRQLSTVLTLIADCEGKITPQASFLAICPEPLEIKWCSSATFPNYEWATRCKNVFRITLPFFQYGSRKWAFRMEDEPKFTAVWVCITDHAPDEITLKFQRHKLVSGYLQPGEQNICSGWHLSSSKRT
jgi:hypothetical protein